MASTAHPVARNIHATAIVIGTTGILLTGASGSGKSSLAFRIMMAARGAGLFAALVADDQVFIDSVNDHVMGCRPETIAGLMEFRGTGIGSVESVPYALLHIAVQVVPGGQSERLPPENERFSLAGDWSLPLLAIPDTTADPFGLICVFRPELMASSGKLP